MAVLTAAEITAWLNDPNAIRGILVEANVRVIGTDTDITRYFSSFNYVTSPTDTPSNIAYDAVISGGLNYTEKMDYTGSTQPSLSVGDIEIYNANGNFDSYLDDVWVNRPIKIFVGDVRWPRDSFFVVFSGVLADIDSRARGAINFKIRDKLARLNTPISEIKYADVQPYPYSNNVTPYHNPTDPTSVVPDIFLPVAFGESFNVTPILIDSGNRIYIVNYGPFNGIIELRDNGVPLAIGSSYTVDNQKGTFQMLHDPLGVLTASIQGDNDTNAAGITEYRNTVSKLIRRIVTGYGKVVIDQLTGLPKVLVDSVSGIKSLMPHPDRFALSDLDLDNFISFENNSYNRKPVGIFISSRDNLLTTCQQIAGSVGSQLAMTRNGTLKLLTLASPPLGTPISITDDDMVSKSLAISGRTDIQGAINLGYDKSWTVQDTLLTNLPYAHKQMYALEYSTFIKADADTITKYNITSYPEQQTTLLLVQSDAEEEANRRLSLYKVQHTIYKFVGFPNLFDLKLGDTVQLTHSRFGLSSGKLGTVVSLTPNWLTAKITVEVFI